MRLATVYVCVCLSVISLFASATACIASTTKPLHALPAGAAVLRAPTDPNHFLFVLTGDNRAAGRGVPMPPTLDRICTEIGLIQPAFTLWTGDAIYGSDESIDEANGEYDVFLRSIANTGTPVYNAPGNHEIFDRPEMEALYKKRIGPLYGSFDYGASHFIAINTEEIGLNGGIGKGQMKWLEQDLEANRKAAHIFVFMHHPLFPKPGEKEGWSSSENRDAVHQLFVKYNVKNVFSGHEHLYYHGVHDGINYYISGGAGAPTDASPEEGGYLHYVLLKVAGDNVTPVILQPWRVFVSRSSASADGSETYLASNYNNDDLDVYVNIPRAALADKPVINASVVYKGKTKQLDAAIEPSARANAVVVKVTVPAHRTATVTVKSQ